VPRHRTIKLADPLDFDHEADAQNYADVHDLPGGDVLLTPADLAKRWRTTVGALRKQRERGSGPAFICLNSRIIRYRLLDVVNFEANRVAYKVSEARSIGLLCIAAFTVVMLRGEVRLTSNTPRLRFPLHRTKKSSRGPRAGQREWKVSRLNQTLVTKPAPRRRRRKGGESERTVTDDLNFHRLRYRKGVPVSRAKTQPRQRELINAQPSYRIFCPAPKSPGAAHCDRSRHVPRS
jgi:hypothetical protein